MKSKLLLVSVMAFAIHVIFFCPKLEAQNLAPEEKHTLSIGAEGGWMRNLQSGSFRSYCECAPTHEGKGNNGLASIFVEFELNPYISLGAKFGLDFKSTISSQNGTEKLLAYNVTNDSIFAGNLDIVSSITISAKYLFFAPLITFTPFRQGFFIQFAPEFGSLTSSNITQTRELSNTSTQESLRLGNGTRKETLEDESIPEANKLRVALLFLPDMIFSF